jgi:hypothetical protein
MKLIRAGLQVVTPRNARDLGVCRLGSSAGASKNPRSLALLGMTVHL